ncbi:5-formyltetrahydrofolate cyclo-ligase [Aquibacillus albus]|uniref:5-formyltetrahydrofolate cyclo-ligase n=1 Tax=Aquibacillus albus TaxID=1168171 RepID=A0ABS2MV02_9BACI|nr:5-formyltetrahydrofolate cyclo-ligase [Aquibacillus albus]MBM7569665.1 5-formyltetrahydrofolate cyclo-ligase [Aquibacillus albus]
MTKKEKLRSETLQILREISEEEKEQVERNIGRHLVHSECWEKAKTIGVTISTNNEWDTRKLIEAAWTQKKRVCVPKCFPKDKRMVFYELHTFEDLETVYHHLLEPKPNGDFIVTKNQIDLMIVPGIVFDYKGFRIGYGGGYYDRYLANYEGTTVSLAIQDQIVEELPTENHDIKVDYIITDQGFVSTSSFY